MLLTAKVALLVLRAADGGGAALIHPWALVALFHEDAILLTLFALCDAGGGAALGRIGLASSSWSRLMGLVFWALVGWTAINVPVARLFATPLTHPMVAAAGAALGDSILAYVTPGNGIALVLVAMAGLVGRRAGLSVWRPRTTAWASGAALLLIALGPAALERVETLGVHRNAAWTLARTTWRHLAPPARVAHGIAETDLGDGGQALDLTHLFGAARGRHVIWVVLESTGARYLQPWGGPGDVMPNLSRLVSRGLLFDRAYAAYPESVKGLFSYLCSTWPAAHTSASAYGSDRIAAPCVGTSFAAAGYRTGLFHSGRFAYLGMAHVVRDRGFQVLADAATIGGPDAASFGTDDRSTADAVLAWIDGLAPTDRFLAVYMPTSGHHPYNAPGNGPRPFESRSEFDDYRNDLYAGDAALGALVDGIRARGLDQDVMWVVFGDHGEAFHQHPGNMAHSLHIWEENVHVPLAFVIPGVLTQAVRVPQVASLIDVLPTTMALAGLPPSPRHQGQSLLAPHGGVARFFTDHGLWKMGLREDRWKLILEVESGRTRLFDLDVDPDERDDVGDDHRPRVRRYVSHLEAWHRRQADRIARYGEVVGPGSD